MTGFINGRKEAFVNHGIIHHQYSEIWTYLLNDGFIEMRITNVLCII